MRDAYRNWISAYLARVEGRVLGRCREATAEMRSAFPELREVRGHVLTLGWGKRGHVWLADEAGEIVDPTASQFATILSYEPWKPGDEVLIGKCMNCGEGIWRSVQTLEVEPPRTYSCSTECEAELLEAFA